MITDCFDRDRESIISLRDFYGEPGHCADICLIIFSKEIHAYLLNNFACETVGKLTSVNGNKPIYRLCCDGKRVAFYLSGIGSAIASMECCEANWITGASSFILFGSCGSLDAEKTKGRFILPTESYRGEGCSYYYAEPADYIAIKNSGRLAEIFRELRVPYVQGRVWTTDSMLRETRALTAQRRAEGCIAVEMEVAGVQAVCDFYGFSLYCFLEAGDVLQESGYEMEGLDSANHSIGKLHIALQTAQRI